MLECLDVWSLEKAIYILYAQECKPERSHPLVKTPVRLHFQRSSPFGRLPATLGRLRKLLEKLAALKTLTVGQARRAIRDLRKTDSRKVWQLFVELKTMGLPETQGTGSKLALIPKELTKSEELQKQHKPCSTDVV